MWPRIGPVPTYSIFYGLGLLCHFLISRRSARRLGLQRRVWIVISACYLLGMTVGAKVLYDLREGQLDLSVLLSPTHFMHGGLWGGLLAYFALAVPTALVLSRQRTAALDLIALSTPIPWIMAKLGCLCNGCCYGRPCSLPWAITFGEGARGAPAGVPVHPTQLYEIALMGILLVTFSLLVSKRWRGTKLLWFLIVYGLGRAATDALRGDTEHYLVGPLSLTQLLCLAAAGAALAALALVVRPSSRRQRAR